MIRPAALTDAPQIERLIREQHARSKYAGRCRIAEPALKELVAAMIAQQNHIGAHGTCLFVAERRGKPVAMIAGIVDRIYQIGAKMKAQDLFLINEGGTVADTLALVDAYLAWAGSIRAVLEISLSWVDTIPGAERVAKLFERKGLAKSGEIYSINTDAEAMKEAA